MKTTIAILILVLVFGGAYYLSRNQPADTSKAEEGAVQNTMPVPGVEGVEEMVVEDDGALAADDTNSLVNLINVEGGKFYFKPNTITAKKGETVRITFKNVDGLHDFVIDEFNVKTKQLQGGTEETVEFVADKVGTFEYYCSVGTHRQMGMVGTLTVTE
ncbi:MAG: cupredoxin domain-containing protein [Patescibacteria group bacterium]